MAPEPTEPPLAVSVVEDPLQMDVVPIMDVGAVAAVLTLTVVVTPPVVLEQGEDPTLLTQ